MGDLLQNLHIIRRDNEVLIQRACYIEDGPYIVSTQDAWSVYEIPSFGGDARFEGCYSTLIDALDKYQWILDNYT